MTDRTAALFEGLDGPRAVPAPARMRLVSALEIALLPPVAENLRAILDRPKRLPLDMRDRMELMLIGEDDADIALTMEGIDEPRALAPIARDRLERRLAAEQRRRVARTWQMAGAAAAAVLVLIGSVVLTRPDRGPGRLDGRPGAIRPTIIDPTRIVLPPPQQTPTVQGTREVRPPTSPSNSGRAGSEGSAPLDVIPIDGAVAQPQQPQDQTGLPARGSARGEGLTPRTAQSQGLLSLDPVTSLLDEVLRILEAAGIRLDALADISKSQPPAAPTSSTSATPPRRSRARRSARTRATPKTSAPAPASKQAPSGLKTVTTAVDGIVREIIDVSVLSSDPIPAVEIRL